MVEHLTIDMFAARVGETFRMCVQPGLALDLELVQVTPLGDKQGRGPHAAAARREPFSLVFQGPGDRIAPQRIYLIEHDGIGSHELFLVPIGPARPGGPGHAAHAVIAGTVTGVGDGGAQAGMLYEAIFT
jgi:hypothetical protein